MNDDSGSGSFDPMQFLDGVVEGALTKVPPLPSGEYQAQVLPFNEKSLTLNKQRKNGEGTWSGLNVRLEIDLAAYPAAAQATGQEKVTLYHLVMLDLTSSGSIDTSPGKNRGLRQYREATGQNTGQWSPRMLEHQMVRVKVGQEDYQGEIVSRVEAIAAL